MIKETSDKILIILISILLGICIWALYGNPGWILKVEAQKSIITIPPPATPEDVYFSERLPYPKEEIKSYIRLRLREKNVDSVLALRIANAESEFVNKCNTGGCRYGIGVFQIVQTTFNEQCQGNIYNNADNINCAIKMMSKNQYWRWNQSKSCWKY